MSKIIKINTEKRKREIFYYYVKFPDKPLREIAEIFNTSYSVITKVTTEGFLKKWHKS